MRVTAALRVAALCVASTYAGQAEKVFTDRDRNIAIEPPPDWTVKAMEKAPSQLALEDPDHKAFLLVGRSAKADFADESLDD